MNMEIGTEAAQFPEKEYINRIFLAVHASVWVVPVIRGVTKSSCWSCFEYKKKVRQRWLNSLEDN